MSPQLSLPPFWTEASTSLAAAIEFTAEVDGVEQAKAPLQISGLMTDWKLQRPRKATKYSRIFDSKTLAF
jgi:hypothetical protein